MKIGIVFFLVLSINFGCSNKGLPNDPLLKDAATFFLIFNIVESGMIFSQASTDFLASTPPGTLSAVSGTATDSISAALSSPNDGSYSFSSEISFNAGTYSSDYAKAITEKQVMQVENKVTLGITAYSLTYKGNTYALAGNGNYVSTIISTGIYFDTNGLHVPNARTFKLTGTGVTLEYNSKSYTGTFTIDSSAADGGTLTVNGHSFSYKEVMNYLSNNGANFPY